LRAREEENKKILNAVVSGLYIYDFEKQYNEYINPSYTAITGWTLDDIHAMGKNFHGLFHQEDLNKFNRHMDRIQNSKTDYFRTMEYRFQTKNDGWKWLLTYDVPFERDIDGKVKKVLGTFIDVSERKKIEKALLESERKAQEANRAKSEFIANMSHEIRTPLNGVIGFTDLMMTTTLNKDQQQYIQNIQSASIVLMDLINDILDFSKIEAGKLELENEEFNLLEMLERTVEVIKIKAQEKNIELLFDYSPEAPVRVYGDAVRLRQIILNFLSNAVKFTEKGEIELSVKISNRNEDDKLIRLRFSVRDTGIGIPENKKSDILQQFSQADNSITRKYGGTGLGLSIAKKIIDKMGSEMNIETHPGMGSCFSFEVDLHYSDTMECRSQKIPFSSVLIVDDNRKNLEILEKIFKHWHIKVELSHNGFEALQKLETMMNTIDLIIMDYAMPYMNGIETIKKMKSELKMTADNKPMIILYSSIDSGIAEEDTVDGFIDRKLVKPATMNTLLKVLCNHNENINQKQKHEKSGALSGTILIAEDNTLNRELIKKYLKKIGVFSVFEAENGKKAIDLYVKNKESIDLILMDIQMPEIDGYRAAHEIRSIEGQNSNLKIIALTARSIKGEEEKAKEAGMNEFISKPIRLDTLRALLRRTLPKTSVSLKNWIEKYLTTMELSPSEIEEIISEYAHSLKNSIKKLQDAILSEDFDTIEKISHMIKGTSANVGGQPLVDLFTQMNNMLKNGDHNSIKIQMILEKVIPISNLLQEEII
jgi:PAS domain S-box-containing protein